jgi:hypothetical protein
MMSTAALAPIAGPPGMVRKRDDKHFLATLNDNDIIRKAFQAESLHASCASARPDRSQRNNSFLEQVKCRIHRRRNVGPEPGTLLLVPSLRLDALT